LHMDPITLGAWAYQAARELVTAVALIFGGVSGAPSPDGSAPSGKLPYTCENTYAQEICQDASGGMPK